MLFFFVTVLKVGVLTEQVDSVLTDELRYRFSFDAAFVTMGMSLTIAGALLVATAMAASQLIQAARQPVLKMESTRSVPDLPLHQAHKWHMFLSHSE